MNLFGSVSVKHPNLFGRSEKLDVLWDKGLQDSSVIIAFRRPRPGWLSQQSFVIQVSRLVTHNNKKNIKFDSCRQMLGYRAKIYR